MRVRDLFFKQISIISISVLLTTSCSLDAVEATISPQITGTSFAGLVTSTPNDEVPTVTIDSTSLSVPDLQPSPRPSSTSPLPTSTIVSQEQLSDEARATQEAQAQQATIEASELVESPEEEELACTAQAETVESPSLYLLCGNDIAPAPANTPFIRGETLAEAEALLIAYTLELLRDVSPTNANAGYESYFSDSSVLNSLTLTASGDVSLDFNEKFVDQYGQLHGSNAVRMLDQLNRTIFQFYEVNTLAVTLNGRCEAFAELFEFSCVNLDRELWQVMLELNESQVETFNLREE